MRILTHMLCFNSLEMIEGALVNFAATVSADAPIEKTMFACGFPYPADHRAKLELLAARYGWAFAEIENRGVAENWNQVCFEHFKIAPDDVVIGFDPDVRMEAAGWLEAMVTALKAQDEAPYIMASRRFQDEPVWVKSLGRETFKVAGVRLARFDKLVAWSMGGYRADWLLKVGGFGQYNKVYGFIEAEMWDKMQAHKKTFYALADHYDDHQPADPLYMEWKIQSAGKKTELKFEEWVESYRASRG